MSKKPNKKKENNEELVEKKDTNIAAEAVKTTSTFFGDVKGELKKVTWPDKTELIKWSVIVFCVLIFFSIFTLVVDNFIVTPLLYLISDIHF